ncbi:MAG: hypothetical protein K8T25_02535 [Planctomycetia bacterium]|nr:hypothetical protein [Planctomycetia bacterium]
MTHPTRITLIALLCAGSLAGCQTPASHTDQGALLGGLGGAGVGAIIGKQSGNTGAGAVIGAAAGALTGAVVGNKMDEADARNRALIEQQLGRRVNASAVTSQDVITMTQAHVGDELIVTHIRVHGVAAPVGTNDVIQLKQSGVSDRVIQAMQTAPPPGAVVAPGPPPQPVIIEEHYGYPRPYWGPGYWGGYRPYHRPGWSVGVGIGG